MKVKLENPVLLEITDGDLAFMIVKEFDYELINNGIIIAAGDLYDYSDGVATNQGEHTMQLSTTIDGYHKEVKG